MEQPKTVREKLNEVNDIIKTLTPIFAECLNEDKVQPTDNVQQARPTVFALRLELQQIKRENDQLRNDLNMSNTSYNTQRSKNDDLLAHIKRLVEKNKQMELEAQLQTESLFSEMREKDEKSKNDEKIIKQLHAKIANYEQNIENLKFDFNNLEEEKGNLEQLIRNLTDENTQFTRQFRTLINKYSARDTKDIQEGWTVEDKQDLLKSFEDMYIAEVDKCNIKNNELVRENLNLQETITNNSIWNEDRFRNLLEWIGNFFNESITPLDQTIKTTFETTFENARNNFAQHKTEEGLNDLDSVVTLYMSALQKSINNWDETRVSQFFEWIGESFEGTTSLDQSINQTIKTKFVDATNKFVQNNIDEALNDLNSVLTFYMKNKSLAIF